MLPLVLRLLICLLGLVVCAGSTGQELRMLPSQPEVKVAIPTDPLGRQTPEGCFLGFLNAARLGNYQTASQYLQLSPVLRKSKGEQLSIQLKSALDLGLVGPLTDVSANADGTVEEGLPLELERVGRVSVNNREINVDLIRINDADVGEIWLFSADTLAKIPELYEKLQAQSANTKLPAILVRNEFLEAPVWQWLALLSAIPVSAAIAWLMLLVTNLPVRLWRLHFKRSTINNWTQVSGPVWLIIGVFIDTLLFDSIGLPILYRHYYYILLKIGFAIGVAWLVLRMVTLGMGKLKNRAITHGRPEAVSLVLLGQRLLKALVLVLAGLAIMRAFGFDTSTVLAGVGIGGLAISFGAQKTIENLFGGATILGDSVIHVGDICRIGDRIGTIEDISLRSTRIRTLERTELSVPNGTLATINLENLSRRDKILFNPTLGLRYETAPDQMRFFLAEVRRLLYQHPKIETSSARVRLADFGDNALSVEIFSFVSTRDYAEFTAIREDLMLQIMEIVIKAGTGFAFPSRTVYLGKDAGLNPELIEAAVQRTQQWRDDEKLPFPDFSPEEIAEMSNSVRHR